MDKMLGQLILDRKRWHRIGEPLTFTMFNIHNDAERSSLHVNRTLLHFRLLIDLLLRLKSKTHPREKLIELCRKEYVGKESDLRMIDEFDKNYVEGSAVWWCTRETFLYRRLNWAFRLQNVNWLFHLRFFICDMHAQLKQLQERTIFASSLTRVYRSQRMSPAEVRQMKDSIGGLISFISFLSTTSNRNYALTMFGDDPTVFTDVQPVLFEITVNHPRQDYSKPFADITDISAFADAEDETLFMAASLFNLDGMYMENFVTVFQLRLCSDADMGEFKALVDQMETEIGIGTDDSLLTLGTLLWKSGRYDQADQFYHRMIEELPSDHELVLNCYQGFGFIAAAKGDLSDAFHWQNKSLEAAQRHLQPDNYRLGCIWNSIGNIHWRSKAYDQALDAYERAKTIFGEKHDRDLGSCLSNMGNVYEERGRYSEALQHHQRAIELREGILRPNHPELGTSYHNIANVYYRLNQLDRAQSYSKRALKIFHKSLRSNDPTIATTYQTLAGIEIARGGYRQGLKYLEEAAGIFRETLPPDHPTLRDIHRDILKVMWAMSETGFDYI